LIASGNPAKLWGGTGAAGGDVRVKVTMPNGDVMEVGAKDGVADFGETDQLGFYEVAWPAGPDGGGERKSLFAVNLLSATESDIRPQALQTAAGGVTGMPSVARVNREIWRWLAVAALVILLLEWWAYHRRIA